LLYACFLSLVKGTICDACLISQYLWPVLCDAMEHVPALSEVEHTKR